MADKPKKEQILVKSLIDATGNVVDDELKATGVRVGRAGQTADLQSGGNPGEPITLYAIFGISTHATNDASTVRQENKDAKGVAQPAPEDELAAIVDFHAMVYGEGKWTDDTPRIGGLRLNVDRMAQAAINLRQANGKPVDDGMLAAVKGKLQDKDVLKSYADIPELAAEYARLTKAGKAQANQPTLDSLFS